VYYVEKMKSIENKKKKGGGGGGGGGGGNKLLGTGGPAVGTRPDDVA